MSYGLVFILYDCDIRAVLRVYSVLKELVRAVANAKTTCASINDQCAARERV
jgi:hypothetical protein